MNRSHLANLKLEIEQLQKEKLHLESEINENKEMLNSHMLKLTTHFNEKEKLMNFINEKNTVLENYEIVIKEAEKNLEKIIGISKDLTSYLKSESQAF